MTRDAIERPKSVVAVVLLLAASALLDVGATSIAMFQKGGLQLFAVGYTAITLAVSTLLIYALYAGHRWARIVVLVFSFIGIPWTVFSVVAATTWDSRLLVATTAIIPIAICVLLMSASARAWYATAGS